MRAKLLAFFLLLIPSAQAQQPTGAARYQDVPIMSLEVAGERRTFGLYTPASRRAGAPLIIALRGRYSSAKAFHAMSGLAGVAEARGALIAYPEPKGPIWDQGRAAPSVDDPFLVELVSALREEYAIDPAQVFVVGYDNGGVTAYRLACAAPFPIAGAAVVNALMWDFIAEGCAAQPARSTPMLILHGRRDPYFPVAGDDAPVGGPTPGRRLSARDTLAFWLGRNGCTEAGEARSASVVAACAGGTTALVSVERGGHAWFRDGAGHQLNRTGVDAARVIDTFLFDRANFAPPRQRVMSDRERSAIVYVPPNYDPARATPVVVALHGRPSNAASMAAVTDFNTTAARAGFIVVYPDGLNNEWNSMGDLVGLEAEYPQDDVGFLTTLVDDLRLDLNIDPARQYVTGFSNGGIMTFRMACSASDRFAGFAVVGAAFYYDLRDECRGNPPAPMLIMHGTADGSIPFDGVILRSRGETRQVSYSVPDGVGYFIIRNGCDAQASRIDIPQQGATPGVQTIRFDQVGCDDEADLRFFLINGGGHQWPGVPDVLPEENFGPVTRDINASDEIWAFFAGHTLRQRR